MNPFDFRGPAFLLFYVVLSTVVIVAARLVRRVIESGPVPRLGEVDPYLIAHLRGGADEALRVTTISLLDRGLLVADGACLVAQEGAVDRVRRPIERAVLTDLEPPGYVSHLLYTRSRPRAACEALADELRRHRLLPDAGQLRARWLLGLGAVAMLWWVAYHKIEIAISRGRYNIGFLIVLALAVPFVVAMAIRARRTTRGERMIEDLQALFAGLRARAHELPPGGATNEVALLAGIFGVTALYGAPFAQAQMLFPTGRAANAGSSSGTSHDTSWSTSSCSSGGSSCGGGGDGGGGGCGGCGS
jgi:uncharacterized protein (TIGR04222 family)